MTPPPPAPKVGPEAGVQAAAAAFTGAADLSSARGFTREVPGHT
ncbi:MAG: hypothetical protein QOD68_726 [Actinomycetota bacterium]|jgi:hypothetical protein|nr:hypothetical protein [Actinomycetota bacterium]